MSTCRQVVSGGGRLYVVDERDAYAAAEALEPGAPGHLRFVEGAPVVTRRPVDPPPRPASRRRPPAPSRPSRRAGRTGWVWWLVALLILALLFARRRSG